MRNPFIADMMSLNEPFISFGNTGGPQGHPMLPGTPTPCIPFKSRRPPAQGERWSAECVMLPHTACR
ncbi:hypothetical protein [Prevotella sp. P3-122]|uniref:hypothetical protein n=1 Tax=Prevotella sp. P3-122 TaxID=2024223 RepID=UPI0011400BE7|nr:hypothetical protein [Prevotella sp. P3-122]